MVPEVQGLLFELVLVWNKIVIGKTSLGNQV